MTPHDRRLRVARLAYLVPLGLLAAACGDSSAPLVPAELAIVGGDQQQVPVGQGAPLPLQVRVQTEGGQAVSGEEVVWAVASGVATVDPDTSGTDANGVATTTVQMGQTAGPVTVTATVRDLPPATFQLTATPGQATIAAAVSGSNQSGPVAEPLANPVVVEARDAFQNPVPGATVVFEPLEGAGTVAETEVVTDEQGRASTTWTLGTTPGEQRLNARIQGATGLTVFRATAEAGAPSTLEKVSGDAQQAPPGDTLTQPLTVRVLDAFGNPVPNAAVSFTTSDGGAFVPPQPTTNAEGQAQTRWVLGADTTRVNQTATASVQGAGSVMFSAVARDPCAERVPYAIGDTATGRLESGDCQPFTDGTFVDIYGLTLSEQGRYEFTLSSTEFDTYLLVYSATTGLPLAVNDDASGGTTDSRIALLARPGEYLVVPNSFSPASGTYTLGSARLSEQFQGCQATWTTAGVTTTQQLASDDCTFAEIPATFDQFAIVLAPGDTLTVDMASTDFDARIDLYGSSGRAATASGGGAGTDARLQFVAGGSQLASYVIVATAESAGQTGAYTLGVSASGAAGASLRAAPASRVAPGLRSGLTPWLEPLKR